MNFYRTVGADVNRSDPKNPAESGCERERLFVRLPGGGVADCFATSPEVPEKPSEANATSNTTVLKLSEANASSNTTVLKLSEANASSNTIVLKLSEVNASSNTTVLKLSEANAAFPKFPKKRAMQTYTYIYSK